MHIAEHETMAWLKSSSFIKHLQSIYKEEDWNHYHGGGAESPIGIFINVHLNQIQLLSYSCFLSSVLNSPSPLVIRVCQGFYKNVHTGPYGQRSKIDDKPSLDQ